jgi:hemerythrin
MTLVWRDQLSVGNDVIDADHRHLIDIINSAGGSLAARDQRGLWASLESLSRYSKTHFESEEKIAAAVRYGPVAQLHESHDALLRKLDQLKAGIQQQWSAASVEHFNALLRDWLLDHVIKEDLLMKPALQKFSPRFDPR